MKRPLPLLGLGLALALLVASCGGLTSSRGWAPPLRTGQLLLVSTGKGHIDGIDAASGNRVWRFPNDWALPKRQNRLEGIYSSPVVSADGQVVFVADYNGNVYAFRPSEFLAGTTTKPPAGYFEFKDGIVGGMALDQTSGMLFVASGKSVYTLAASDLVARIGNDKARVAARALFTARDDIWGTPVLSNGKLFISSLDGNLYAVDQASGKELWAFAGGRPLLSTPVVSGDSLLVGGFGDKLYAVDAASGNQNWSFSTGDWVWSRPAVGNGRAYFGDFDGKVYAVDISNGSEVWSVDLGRGAIRAGPVLAGGLLIVATEDGWLAGLDPTSHEQKWQNKLDTGISADLVAGDDKVLIAPRGCVLPAGSAERVYYVSLDPANGNLNSAAGVC